MQSPPLAQANTQAPDDPTREIRYLQHDYSNPRHAEIHRAHAHRGPQAKPKLRQMKERVKQGATSRHHCPLRAQDTVRPR